MGLRRNSWAIRGHRDIENVRHRGHFGQGGDAVAAVRKTPLHAHALPRYQSLGRLPVSGDEHTVLTLRPVLSNRSTGLQGFVDTDFIGVDSAFRLRGLGSPVIAVSSWCGCSATWVLSRAPAVRCLDLHAARRVRRCAVSVSKGFVLGLPARAMTRCIVERNAKIGALSGGLRASIRR